MAGSALKASFVFIGCFATSWISQAAGRDDKAPLKAITQGYLANREAFPFLKCTFKLKTGAASTWEEARKGTLKDELEANGLWIVNQEKARFELNLTSASEIAYNNSFKAQLASKRSQPKWDGTITTPFNPFKVLDNGKYQLTYHPKIRVAAVAGESQRGQSIYLSPWDMGVMGDNESANPASEITASLDKCTLAQVQNVGGADLLPVTVPSEGLEWTYYFDPARGYLPRQIRIRDKKLNEDASHVSITDVRECSRGRYFPMRSIRIRKEDSYFVVQEITVSELDVDNPPSDGEFAIEIPTSVLVNDGRNLPGQFELPGPRRVGLTELQGFFESSQKGPLDTAHATLLPRTGIRRFYLLAIAAIAIVLVWLVRWRTVRRGSAEKSEKLAS